MMRKPILERTHIFKPMYTWLEGSHQVTVHIMTRIPSLREWGVLFLVLIPLCFLHQLEQTLKKVLLRVYLKYTEMIDLAMINNNFNK